LGVAQYLAWLRDRPAPMEPRVGAFQERYPPYPLLDPAGSYSLPTLPGVFSFETAGSSVAPCSAHTRGSDLSGSSRNSIEQTRGPSPVRL
jgi:hypothetical protein